jgi:hypothetical protein
MIHLTEINAIPIIALFALRYTLAEQYIQVTYAWLKRAKKKPCRLMTGPSFALSAY